MHAEVKFWLRRIKLSSSDNLYTVIPEREEFCVSESTLISLSMKITNAIYSGINYHPQYVKIPLFACFYLFLFLTAAYSWTCFPERSTYMENIFYIYVFFRCMESWWFLWAIIKNRGNHHAWKKVKMRSF